MQKVYWALLLAAAVACGGGSEATGPGTGTANPARTQLVGTWRATNVPGTIYQILEIGITSDASTAANAGPLAGTYSYTYNCGTGPGVSTCTRFGTLVKSTRTGNQAHIEFSPQNGCSTSHAIVSATLSGQTTLGGTIARWPCGNTVGPAEAVTLTRQ